MDDLISTRWQRLRDGDCRHVIDADLRSRRKTIAFRGVHVGTLSPTQRQMWSAGLRCQGPQAVLGYRSAAVIHGLPWIPQQWCGAEAEVELIIPTALRRRRRSGMILRRFDLDRADVVLVDGLPVTTPARTLLDLIRCGSVSERLGIALLDGALHTGLASDEDLRDALRRLELKFGVQQAGRALGRSRAGVESPGETYLRLDLIEGGVPEESLDIPIVIRDDEGFVLARADLGSADLMLWGEYDGLDAHTQKPAFGTDRRGDRWLDGRGWKVFRYSEVDLGKPAVIAREWLAAMREAPQRILAMDPARSPEVAAAQRKLVAMGYQPR